MFPRLQSSLISNTQLKFQICMPQIFKKLSDLWYKNKKNKTIMDTTNCVKTLMHNFIMPSAQVFTHNPYLSDQIIVTTVNTWLNIVCNSFKIQTLFFTQCGCIQNWFVYFGVNTQFCFCIYSKIFYIYTKT